MKTIAEKYGDDTYNVVTGDLKTGDDFGDFAPYKYTVNGKTVSASKYKSYVNSVISGAKNVKLKWHKNTKANRLKYLK